MKKKDLLRSLNNHKGLADLTKITTVHVNSLNVNSRRKMSFYSSILKLKSVFQVSGYSGLLLGSPVILYEIIAFVVPGLTRSERRFLGPIVFGSSILFYTGLVFSYGVLAPAALNFFVTYAEGAVESLWSIDQYFEFILVLMFSTGLSFQV